MGKRIKMYNPKTGKSKNGFIGFSWPILFLAWIPMFARGDIRACLETHLSIMKRFNSMLAMAI